MAGEAASTIGAELVAAMLEPSFYPDGPTSVELRETHISWVFLAGERAYKVKKPLKLPFLDYGTLERRREMCNEEVRLNRRFAPEIYLGVVGIADRAGGWRLVGEEDPAAIEYAVEMRPIDEQRTLAALLARGALGHEQVIAVARRLALIHAEAPVAPPERRPLAVLVATLDENLTTLRDSCAGIGDASRLESAERFTRAFLASRSAELERRAERGLIRDCHGDLRAEHVIVPEQGDVYVFDCVEFDPALRQIDVAADFAFLVMDLIALGGDRVAQTLAGAYRAAGGEPGDDPLLWFFASYRAWVRAKVACLRALELEDGDPERAAKSSEAEERFRLGHRLAWWARRPVVLVICGVAASGKSTLAEAVAEISGFTHLSSDVVRKRLAGLAPDQRAAPELYSPEFTERTYRELGRLAAGELGLAGSVIVDATFHRRLARDAFREGLGEQLATPVLFLECRAPQEVLLERVRRRQAEARRTSDADADVVRRQLAEREPLEEVAASDRADLSAERPVEELVLELESAVDARVL